MRVLHKKRTPVVLAIILAILSIFSFLLPAVTTASAAETSDSIYTDVMDDLLKDKNFDVADYPVVIDDFSLNVIQIAESSDGELFVYVYQPSDPVKDLYATKIRLNTSATDEEATYDDYDLTLLDTDGVFDKYKVENFTVRSDSVRYYEIVQIMRLWDASIDKALDNDNTISQVSFEVAQIWTVYTVDGKVYYTMDEVETIQITSKFAGFLRYPQNLWDWHLGYEKFDIHFVAFSTDKPIDKILEVDLLYNSQEFLYDSSYCYGYNDPNCYGDIIKKTVTLKDGDEIHLSGSGWRSLQYNWNAIEPMDDFMKSEHLTYTYELGFFNAYVSTKLTEESKEALAGKNWVLRYAVTEYGHWENGKGDWSKDWHTIVSDTSLLRIKFDMDGEVYNLGVVDNYQSEGRKPSNIVDIDFKPSWLLMLIILLLILFLLSPWLAPIFTFLFKVIGKVLSIVWKIVSAPFVALGNLFHQRE